MALRAVSIVGLESSIRAQFDRQIDEVQRSVQEHHQRQINSRRGSRARTDEVRQIEENGDENGNEDSNSNPNNGSTSTQPEDMEESGDLGHSTAVLQPLPSDSVAGQITAPGTPSNSMDIRVDYEAFPDVAEPSENGDSIDDTIEREIQGLSRDENNNRNVSCCKFYRSHWVGHLVTGIMSGCLFVLLGIIFLINESQTIPVYAGITLIILGLAPCCMALNRYRYARLYERERRRAVRRLAALRRVHRRNAREERRRRRQAYSDLPPAYDNLGFDLGEGDLEFDFDAVSVETSTSQGSFVLPTYEQCVKKETEISGKRTESVSAELPTFDIRPNNGNNDGESSLEQQISEVAVQRPEDIDNIEIVETRFENDHETSSNWESQSRGTETGPNNDNDASPNADSGEVSDA